MKTIAQQLGVKSFPFIITDDDGNRIYYEDSTGFWYKREFHSKGNTAYFEEPTGIWYKAEFDLDGKQIYHENSNGYIIDNRPKTKELTMDEMASKFNIPLDFLKIKK